MEENSLNLNESDSLKIRTTFDDALRYLQCNNLCGCDEDKHSHSIQNWEEWCETYIFNWIWMEAKFKNWIFFSLSFHSKWVWVKITISKMKINILWWNSVRVNALYASQERKNVVVVVVNNCCQNFPAGSLFMP